MAVDARAEKSCVLLEELGADGTFGLEMKVWFYAPGSCCGY